MLTPYGKDCPYYYANFHRRSNAVARCNLITEGPDAQDWNVSLCETCPVPAIKRANSCPTMHLSLRIIKHGLKFWQKDHVVVLATCSRHNGPVKDPMVGCGKCHTPINFVVATNHPDD